MRCHAPARTCSHQGSRARLSEHLACHKHTAPKQVQPAQHAVALLASALVLSAPQSLLPPLALANEPAAPVQVEQQEQVKRPAAEPTRQRLAEVAASVKRDFVEGQYYVTGKLTPSIYEPDALFTDPTTRVQGVEKYTTALASLFDPATSRADLISIEEAPQDNAIILRWRLEGRLKLLGGLSIKPYTGTTRYTLDQAGLISRHEETWDISATDALVSTFIPSFGAPPAPPVVQ